MVVRVCDAIMGSGKSESAITYINEHPDKKFVYITPYLDEARRICCSCKDADFAEPSDKIEKYGYSKLEHTRSLLSYGRNIATTHAAFRSYTRDMIRYISDNEYTLIVDESVEVFQEAKYNDGDIKLLERGGFIKNVDGAYECTGEEYTGSRLRDLYDMFKCNNIVPVERNTRGMQYYYWTLPYEILTSFSDVIVLTYMFECQDMKYFLDINNIEYRYIGISYKNNTYMFSEDEHYVPGYVSDILSKVHIFNNKKLNSIGKNKYSLSVNWMKNDSDGTASLKNNVYNYLRYYNDCRGEDIMWSTFNGSEKKITGRGYSKQYTVFNLKASNDLRNKTVLAYCVNVFVSPSKKNYFSNYGIEYDEDGYALSVMIQWIWRSAIRDGHDISIYVPSARMRSLLIEWLKSFKRGD